MSLQNMARFYLADRAAFSGISGVGEQKLAEFGAVFLAEITEHLGAHPRQVFPS